jgi:hypothetical protein
MRKIHFSLVRGVAPSEGVALTARDGEVFSAYIQEISSSFQLLAFRTSILFCLQSHPNWRYQLHLCHSGRLDPKSRHVHGALLGCNE